MILTLDAILQHNVEVTRTIDVISLVVDKTWDQYLHLPDINSEQGQNLRDRYSKQLHHARAARHGYIDVEDQKALAKVMTLYLK